MTAPSIARLDFKPEFAKYMMAASVRLSELTKLYGATRAVDRLSLSIAPGDMVGPPDYRPGVPLEIWGGSSCVDTAPSPGADALSISSAICSCRTISLPRCASSQGVVASVRSLRPRAAAAR